MADYEPRNVLVTGGAGEFTLQLRAVVSLANSSGVLTELL